MFDSNNPFRKGDSLVDAVRSILSGQPLEVQEKLDKVDPKALKGKHSDRNDKDIDNDGDVDDSDEYLHNRRKAISKATKESEDEMDDDGKKKKVGSKKDEIDTKPNIVDGKMTTEMTDTQMKKREEIVKSMKKKMPDFKKKYGDRAKDVMYATATKMAMKEGFELGIEKSDLIEEVELDETKYSYKASTFNGNVVKGTGKTKEAARKDAEDKAKALGSTIRTGLLQRLPEEVDLDEGFSPKEIKMAIGIASDKRYAGGNMSGAANAINKIKPGLSGHPQVRAVLRRQNEETDLDEAKMSASQIATLKKAYEPMRGKKISMPSGQKLISIMDKVDDDKQALIQLVKADIPFVSQLAITRLISKHDMKGAEIRKMQEEVEVIDEAKSGTGYDLYHKDFSSAMKHAYAHAKKKHGITVDPQEIDDKVASGPRKPSEGKTNSYRLKGDKGAIQVQVYNKGGSKPFELNMYKEEVELDETMDTCIDNIKEGTWTLPDTTKQKAQLKKLMSKPIILGKEGDDAQDKMYNLIGDDELFDDLYVAGKKNPNGDARPIILKYIKSFKIKEEVDEARRGRPRKDGSSGEDSEGLENIQMQLRKSITLRGQKNVEFADGTKVKIPEKVAQIVLAAIDKIRLPKDKHNAARYIMRSHKNLMKYATGKVSANDMDLDIQRKKNLDIPGIPGVKIEGIKNEKST